MELKLKCKIHPNKDKMRIRLKSFFPNFVYLFSLIAFLIKIPVAKAQTVSKIDSLKTELFQADDPALKINLNISLSREMQRHQFPEEEYLFYAEKAVDLGLEFQDTLLYARALDNLGLLYRFQQNYIEALPLHARAFELVENNEEIPSIFKMIFADNAGLAARYDQNYDLAISYYMKALSLAEAENNLKNIAIATNGIGNALGNIPERREEAIGFLKRSLEAEMQRGNTLGIAMNYLSISDYYINKKEFGIAWDYLDKLLEINLERKDNFGIAITYQFMGLAFMEEGKNLDKAKSYFENSLARFEDLKNVHKQAEIYRNIGQTEWKRNETEEAKKYFNRALELALQVKRFDLIEINSMALSDIAEAENDFESALHFYKQSEAYKDSINLGQQNLTIESLIRKYDISEKENYIQLLEKDQALHQTLLKNQEEKLKRRRLYVLFLSVGIISVVIIFLLLYRNHVAKKEAQLRLIKEEKEKINAVYERNLARAETIANRLRINPHFLFNSLNAITYLVQSNQNEEAIKYLSVFSRYTRMLLETSTKQVIPVEEELRLARYYMLLEENRFEKGFVFKIEGEDLPELDLIKIPPLLLQPFLENAVWHGLLPKEDQERVLKIKVQPNHEGLKIIIEDNGVGRTAKDKADKNHTSMGIPITNERIDLFNKSYKEKISYEIVDKLDENNKPAGTKVIIKMEFNKSLDEKVSPPTRFPFL